MAELRCPECDSELRTVVEASRGREVARLRCADCGYTSRVGSGPRGLRRRDVAAAGLAGVGFVGLVLELLSLDAFEKMFRDFGADLPPLTQLVVRWNVPAIVLVAAAPALVAGVWLRRRGFGGGGVLLACAAVAALGGALLCLFGLYLPALHLPAEAGR